MKLKKDIFYQNNIPVIFNRVAIGMPADKIKIRELDTFDPEKYEYTTNNFDYQYEFEIKNGLVDSMFVTYVPGRVVGIKLKFFQNMFEKIAEGIDAYSKKENYELANDKSLLCYEAVLTNQYVSVYINANDSYYAVSILKNEDNYDETNISLIYENVAGKLSKSYI